MSTTTSMNPSWTNCASALQFDFFITLHFQNYAQYGKGYRISYPTLRTAAPELVKTMAAPTGVFSSGAVLHLDYPDSPELQIALYYIIHKKLPTDFQPRPEYDHDETIIKSWCFGHKFNIPRFQNAIMRKLLSHLRDNDLSTAAMAVAFRSLPPGSKMRTLLAEELAMNIRDMRFQYRDFEAVRGR